MNNPIFVYDPEYNDVTKLSFKEVIEYLNSLHDKKSYSVDRKEMEKLIK
jgi:hypothetical protein